eukprot:s689_g46.t1
MGKGQKRLEGRSQRERQKVRKQMGSLKDLTLQPRARQRYDKAKTKFYNFLRLNKLELPREILQLDSLLCDYLEWLWSSGEGRALASDTLAALQDASPRIKGRIPGAWRLLKTWHVNEIPCRAPPLPERALEALGDLSIDFTSEGQRVLGLEGSVDDLRYANGPLLIALDLETYSNYQPGKMPQQESAEQDEILLQAAGPPVPLAVFAKCSDAKVTDWATMQGHAAAWAWQTAQGGKAVALSPHPEYHQSEQSRRLFRRLLLWCAAAK